MGTGPQRLLRIICEGPTTTFVNYMPWAHHYFRTSSVLNILIKVRKVALHTHLSRGLPASLVRERTNGRNSHERQERPIGTCANMLFMGPSEMPATLSHGPISILMSNRIRWQSHGICSSCSAALAHSEEPNSDGDMSTDIIFGHYILINTVNTQRSNPLRRNHIGD